MNAARRDERIDDHLTTDGKAEIALRAMRVDRQDAPEHFVCAGREMFKRHPHLRALSRIDARFSRLHRSAVAIAHFDAAEGRLKHFRKPQHHFAWRGRNGAADSGTGMIEMGMRHGRRRRANEERERGGRLNKISHGQRPNAGLPMLMPLPKIGRPIEFGNISSRKKCNCAMAPTPVPLWWLTGMIASTPI